MLSMLLLKTIMADSQLVAAGFLLASFTLFVVNERTSKAKHIQFVSGVNSTMYWVANFMWDMATLFVAAPLVLIVFAAFDIPGKRWFLTL